MARAVCGLEQRSTACPALVSKAAATVSIRESPAGSFAASQRSSTQPGLAFPTPLTARCEHARKYSATVLIHSLDFGSLTLGEARNASKNSFALLYRFDAKSTQPLANNDSGNDLPSKRQRFTAISAKVAWPRKRQAIVRKKSGSGRRGASSDAALACISIP